MGPEPAVVGTAVRCEIVSLSATGRRNAGSMEKRDEPKTLGPGWDHLFLTDTRSQEEKRAAESKELARRRGRKTKNWHLKYFDENGRLKD